MYYSTNYSSIIGNLTLVCFEDKLIGLWIDGQKHFGGSSNSPILKKALPNDNCLIFDKTKRWLDFYFYGKNPSINELSLAPIGSDFQQKVWKILTQIPHGKVVTYGCLAKNIVEKMQKKNMSAQAVGYAIGCNRISIVIPCHRVVGSDGNLTGFSAGIDNKRKLLEIEGIDTDNLKNYMENNLLFK